MTSPWNAEQAVSAELACELIEGQFAALAPVSARLLGVGWDNTAFVVERAEGGGEANAAAGPPHPRPLSREGRGEQECSFVFRFPRREIAVELLKAECRVLPAIAPRLPLNVPVPTFVGQPSERFGWPFAGYAMLPGRVACGAELNQEERCRLAAPLGEFLRALHSLPIAAAAEWGAAPDAWGRLDVGRRAGVVRQRLDEIAGYGLIGDLQPWLAIMDRAASARAPAVSALVHGDLYARHLLVDDERNLCGVIDWGDVHLGDPAVDLAVACSFLPPAARAAFTSAYGPVDESTWHLARYKALLTAVMLVVYGRDVKDEDLLREGLTTLGQLAEEVSGR